MRRLYSFITKLLRAYPTLTSVTTVLMILATLFDAFIVALIIPVLQTFLGNTETATGAMNRAQALIEKFFLVLHIPQTLATALMFLAFLFIVQGAIRFIQIKKQLKLTRLYEHDLARRLFTQYTHANWSFFLHNKIGHLANVITVEMERAASALDHAFKFLSNFFTTALYLVLSLLFSWQLTLLGILMATVVSAILKLCIRKSQELGKKTTEINNRFHSIVLDLLSVIKMIKSSASQTDAIALVNHLIEQKTTLRYKTQLYISFIPSFYVSMVMAILIALIYISIVALHVPFATILIFVYIVYRLIPTLSSMQFSYQQALIFLPGHEEVQRLLKETEKNLERAGGAEFKKPPASIVFESVCFAYDKGKPILHDINLAVADGESIALVGVSGAGKTTILDLLLGLHEPTSGIIRVNGNPLSAYNLTQWRSFIGYLSQDIFLINDTVKTNLTWGQTGIRDEELWHALDQACASEFVKNMSEGLDTIIGDRGVKLSGGQKQRLALARILLRKPHIIILDEALNALDAASAHSILRTIEELFSNTIRICISHELERLQTVGTLYLLENGTIVEHGLWNELAKKGAFEKLKPGV